MEDAEIITLFLQRDPRAIKEAKAKHEHGCYRIAFEVLRNNQDAEEAVNEMWLNVWNAIPPAQPENLFAFLAAAVKNIAVNRIAAENRQKRGGGEIPLALAAADIAALWNSTADFGGHHLCRDGDTGLARAASACD